MRVRVEYSSNNSGGGWWLTDDQWLALEKAGWNVDWKKDSEDPFFRGDDGRWLGALATSATREGLPLGEAIQEWERTTKESSSALGCSCCGPPHSFTAIDAAGHYEYYSPDYPSEGEPYGN